MLFNELQLIEPVLQALSKEGYSSPTPIQQKAIPPILQRSDLLGCAQTGTGKTAAFTIPVLQLMHQQQQESGRKHAQLQTLILTPTRELAIQIGESVKAYGHFLNLRHQVIFGGVPQFSQVQALKRGVDILIATPGRLLDLMQQGHINLSTIQFFVLDEADRMLDMGFVQDVRRIIAKLPAKRQTLFFSATMPKEIQQLANMLLTNPVKVEVTPVSSTAEIIQQSVYFVEKQNKLSLMVKLLEDASIESLLVFTQMKHAADKLARQLNNNGIRTEAIHGNKSQNARQAALNNFKKRKTRVLVATDIAARGIDIDELTHVLNYELPNVPETYVHRIGRTGRAGASGVAFSFCDWSEKTFLTDIQKLIKKEIPVIKGHPYDIVTMHSSPVATTNTNVIPVIQNQARGGGRRYGKTFSQR
ncbi:DEAD/DEAH box helicase [Lacibacter luteus]|uniref:DEAD-box ATP-dependent RNA helicase RhpA n=1 Tax=Lacibacter luteus TaxID=2508719 RepID=A0A4Q1CFX8_9BACT|nr:DEAD/DEAH box helicase [Lacibacter luteus]RXK58923.1 DEAD/DEAH box helicase [Lacibacter luteus]